jgi:hypothetical protein
MTENNEFCECPECVASRRGYNQAIEDVAKLWFERAYHHDEWAKVVLALKKKVD